MVYASPNGVDHGRLDGRGAEERAIAPDADDADEIDGEVENKEGQDTGGSAARNIPDPVLRVTQAGIAGEFVHV
jgi:hypothetical protein